MSDHSIVQESGSVPVGKPDLRPVVEQRHRHKAFYARYPWVIEAPPAWAADWAVDGIYSPPGNSTFVELESIAKALALIEAEAQHNLIETWAPRCRKCDRRTEPQRWTYAIPTCFACLPPPERIEPIDLEYQAAIKYSLGLAAGEQPDDPSGGEVSPWFSDEEDT